MRNAILQHLIKCKILWLLHIMLWATDKCHLLSHCRSNSLLEFVFSWNKLNWKLLWSCLSCWEKRTACNALITPLFCTIFVNLKERSALKEYTNNTVSVLKRDMSAFSDWPHRCTTHIWMCTSRLKDAFYHIWHFFLCLLKYIKLSQRTMMSGYITSLNLDPCLWYCCQKGCDYIHSYRDRTLPGLNIAGKSCSQ